MFDVGVFFQSENVIRDAHECLEFRRVLFRSCGASATGSRGLALAGGAYERGRVAVNYSILGSSMDQSGKLAVAPGAVVVLADAVPDQGGYMVAIVRPRDRKRTRLNSSH